MSTTFLSMAVVLAQCAASPLQAAPEGAWTGGFRLDGKWVTVNVRFSGVAGDTAGRADIVFPFYGGADNAINVPLAAVAQTPAGLHFEIPTRRSKVVFDGRLEGDRLTGRYAYGRQHGTFGLSRSAIVNSRLLEPYYGAYRVAPDRVISILRGWGDARTLNYVDYKTGRVGTLFPASQKDFFSGDGLAVSYPVTLHVSFERDGTDRPTRLLWQDHDPARSVARRLEITEKRLKFSNGAVEIGGTLLLPAGGGQHPVIVVVPGDYGTLRDQLRLWAHHYVSNDIGALILDARGAGESTGPVNASSFDQLAADVIAAVESLRMRDDVDATRIGLFGFSNSAFTTSLAAARSPHVAFLILQSLVGVLPWKQESFRAVRQLQVDGFPEEDVRKAAEFMRLKYEVARTGTGWDGLQAVMDRARLEAWLPYTNPPATLERLQQVYAAVMTYDPLPALEKIKAPVLAMWGANDTYLPVAETVEGFKGAMAKAGNRQYAVRIFPTCNHSLLESETGSPSTGGTETHFCLGMWNLPVEWLRRLGI